MAWPLDLDQDAFLRSVSDPLSDNGFVASQADKLVDWARTGSLWPTAFGLARRAELREITSRKNRSGC